MKTLLAGLALALFLGDACLSLAADGPRVTTIEISGTTRTTRGTVLSLARVHEGDPWTDGLDQEVLKNLKNARLFYDEQVDVAREGDAVTLRLLLKDKWTLIPLPLVIVRSGESLYGLTLFESNLFGLGKTAFASLAVQNGSPGGTLLFIDPRVLGTDFQLFGYFAHYDSVQRVWDEDDKIGSYRERVTGGSIAAGYRVAPRTSVSLALRGHWFREHDAEDDAVPPKNAMERAATVRLRYDGDNADEEVRLGLSGQAAATWGLAGLGDEIGRRELRVQGRAAINPIARHTFVAAVHALWTNEPDYVVEPALGFLRGYEDGRFRPDRLLGVSAEYQIPFARFREAKLSAVGFADAALLHDDYRSMVLRDVQADAGAALAVYVRRVALPVFQLYAAYGFSTGHVLPGLSLGLTFR